MKFYMNKILRYTEICIAEDLTENKLTEIVCFLK